MKKKINYIISGYLKKSLTMSLYAAILKKISINHVYQGFEIPKIDNKPDSIGLQRFLTNFRENDENLSIVVSDPYKQVILPYLNSVTEKAKTIGAVNLIIKNNNGLHGDNIDGDCFMLGLQNESDITLQNHSMFFYGCGGVSSAVAVSMSNIISKIGLVDIDFARSEVLSQRLQKLNPNTIVNIYNRDICIDLNEYTIIYNGTGLGKFSDDPDSIKKSPIHPKDILPDSGYAIDANYTPWETTFLLQSKMNGLKTLNGFSHMLSFTRTHIERITGVTISYAEIKSTANKLISSYG